MRIKWNILVPILTFIFLIGLSAIVILYASGYQLQFTSGKPELAGSGILVATSDPDGAEVFINGHLTTATNNTINLAPGSYKIGIQKDGYFPWTRTVQVDQEVVTKVTAYLFPTAPQLENITSLGVLNPVVDPSGTKIAYTVASQSAQKNGIYIFNTANNLLLTLQSGSQQIVDDTNAPFSTSQLTWSPDGTQLIASMSAQNGATPTQYLLDATSFNNNPQDITETLANVTSGWISDKQAKDASRLAALAAPLRTFLGSNATDLSWSPDETEILYEATHAATLASVITPLPDANTIPQTRSIQPGNYYVYYVKEDKNFQLPISATVNLTPRWFFDGKHIVFVQNAQVKVVDDDGSNENILYGGPFTDGFAVPWPNGSKIVILTNLGNPEITPNLYTINLR